MSPVIIIEKLTKKYRIPHIKKDTLFDYLIGYIRNQITYEDFNVLNNITITINKGETVGIIGKNGSGKTTLLKIIAGIISPTKGSIKTKGKIAPFLGLGVGFHPELSALENIYLYGAILGIKRKKMSKRVEHILTLAGVKRFEDMKIKHFSSGMVARLAFAVMIETKPDILLLDEIFAVGDKDFKPQSERIMKKYKEQGKTILFATHSLSMIKKHCDKTLLLDKGNVLAFGPTKKILEKYKTI